jgi:hypothetical protein
MIQITIKEGGKEVDITADERQKIEDVINLLKEEGILPQAGKSNIYHSALNESVYSSDMSFKECSIMSGDILSAAV